VPGLFSKPPAPPPLPKMAPPTNTTLTASLAQMQKAQSENAAVVSNRKAPRATTLTHTLTG
jgi:hypothetical protein